MRMVRSTMLEVLREDYIRTAWAKGLRERTVVTRHALKNAFIPVVTIFGTEFSYLMGGAVIIETIFNLPGVGQLTLESILNRDYPQVPGQRPPCSFGDDLHEFVGGHLLRLARPANPLRKRLKLAEHWHNEST